MDDHIGIIAPAAIALAIVSLIALQIRAHITGRIRPKLPRRMKPRVALGCVVVWIIVAIPLINMFLPVDIVVPGNPKPVPMRDRPIIMAFIVTIPAIGFLGLWYRSYYYFGRGDSGYIGD